MIGSATVRDSSRKRQRPSLEETSPLSSNKRSSRFDWMDSKESPKSRRSPRRTPQNGQSGGRYTPRVRGSVSAKKESFVRCLERDITDSLSPEMSPGSFYGSKRRRYLSPLERREAQADEEQRRKRLGESEEEEEKESHIKISEVKTPKSNIKKSSSSSRKTPSNNSKGKVVSGGMRCGSVRKTLEAKTSEKSLGTVNREPVATRTSPRKKSIQLSDTPRQRLFNKHTEEVKSETTLRRSPRKQPPKEDPHCDSNGQTNQMTGSFENPRQKVSSAKKPGGVSKGIKLYMQTLNKNKKNLTPLSKSTNKSAQRNKAAARTPKSAFDKRSPSLTPKSTTPKSNKQDTDCKNSNFFTEDDDDEVESNDSSRTVEITPAKAKGHDSSAANRTPQQVSCHNESTNKSPRKRKLDVTPEKSSKRMKPSEDEINQNTPESDENSEEKVQPDKKTTALKMFPIFTNLSTPSRSEKSANKSKPRVDSSSRLSTSPGIFHHSPKQRKSPILKKSKSKDGKEQMILDLGQKRFGATMCPTCGMVYSMADPEDESDHIRFHSKFTDCVKFPGWKKEHVLQEFHDGRIIMISADDPKYALKKVEDVRELVDTELGFLEGSMACKADSKAFLFISNEKKVVGCCIVEKISKGYRVLTDNEQNYSEDSLEDRKRAWCCSNEPVDVVCGISRIWVWGQMRRKKIATRLMDCLKCNFTYGCTLSNDDIAFSDPTPDGKIFATKYTGTAKFLVYNFTINSQ